MNAALLRYPLEDVHVNKHASTISHLKETQRGKDHKQEEDHMEISSLQLILERTDYEKLNQIEMDLEDTWDEHGM